MKIFRVASACAYIHDVKNSRGRIQLVTTSGFICGPVYERLRGAMVRHLIGVPSFVFRLDGAVTAITYPPKLVEYNGGDHMPGAAMIVRPEEYKFWADYSAKVSARGFQLGIFTALEAPQAFRFAEHQARLRTPSTFAAIL